MSATLGRIKLNRPLAPYPHMGSGLIPPYGPALTTYGTSYGTSTVTAVYNQYQAAILARQTLANDIYRRLLALTGVTPSATPATPTSTDLAPRRWLAQLAVNIVDYIDEDDISTPFPFYTQQDTNPATTPTFNSTTPAPTTQGGDDTVATGANPIYWVFGTELPKVVLNEAVAEANDPDPTNPADTTDKVDVWVELYNPMPAPAAGSNVHPSDSYRVPFYMTWAGGTNYSPYRITLTTGLMPNQPPATAPLTDATCNVLGKAISPTVGSLSPLPQSTTDPDFSTTPKLVNGNTQAAANPATVTGAGIDPGNYMLIGPQTPDYTSPFPTAAAPGLAPNVPVVGTAASLQYATPHWNMASTTDERTLGLTILLRRLANPYLPYNGSPLAGVFYNPYVTVDYLQSVPVRANGNAMIDALPYPSRGKCQPYGALTLLNGGNVRTLQSYSPVFDQQTAAAAAIGNVKSTFGYQNNPLPPSGNYDWLVHLDRQVISPLELLHISGYQPYQLTQRFMLGSDNLTNTTNATNPPNATNVANMFGHYVPWLDAIQNANTTANQTGNVAAPWWYDYATGVATAGSATVTMGNTAGLNATDAVTVIQLNPQVSPNPPNPPTILSTTISTVTANTSIMLAKNWTGTTGTVIIVDANNAAQSHRLYRLFEFLECGDRAYGVDGWGRKPGLININTIWDAEPLQAILDANPSIGITSLPPQYPSLNTNDTTATIALNMLNSRSPSAFTLNQLTAADRPFLPLSIGFTAAPSTQYQNGGTRATQDTLLRLATQNGNNPQAFLFQNPTDTNINTTTSLPHPYMQTQVLNKLYNNVTTRSNVFAIWLTVGFFEVTNPATVPPTLGAEIGRSEGRHIRHRMFAIVDRTNLNVDRTNPNLFLNNTFQTTVSAPGYVPPPIPQSILIPSPPAAAPQTVTIQLAQAGGMNPFTGAVWSLAAGTSVVFEPGTDNEETVVLQAPPAGDVFPGQFNATFYKSHLPGVPVMLRGNPGPWTLIPYDPRKDPLVVPHYNIID